MDRPVTLITGTRTGIVKCLAHHYVRRGHVVTAVDGAPVRSTLDYARVVLSRRPGETVTFELERPGGASHEGPTRRWSGLGVHQRQDRPAPG